MMKPDCLYNQGMKILSCPISADDKFVWKHDGINIAYYRNCIQHRPGCNYYTLTFTISAHDKAMYISSDYPYKYSDLKEFLEEHCTEQNFHKVRTATHCKTLAGNDCPLLIITNFESTAEEISRRPAAIFTARVHPG